jgi:ABC-type bacteriocin/lantibiotic exporter with double-glycine peptidase domain
MALVEECLAKVINGKTVINITHNLQSLKNYCHIIVLDKGYKKEDGSFDYIQTRKG